ncbi:toxin glutamine deamidase domain-containing protein, partial [Yersinia massiliensis]|uniref:toxin glutamine deamidase domain-containing protein n=3 Tax=Yersinia TaxID=629 RepID=UPI0021BDE8B2
AAQYVIKWSLPIRQHNVLGKMMVNSISNAGAFVKPVMDPLALNPSIVGCGSLESLHSSYDLHGSFDDISEYSLGDLSTYAPPEKIENKEALFGIKPDRYAFGKEAYFDYLLTEVNREGKPPLFLRPIAALLALFGIHGFGQTNCASCATAVIDTFEQNKLYLALPTLRGADVKGNMGLPKDDEVGMSAAKLIAQLETYKPDSELYGVLVIHRPTLWTMLPGATRGHACNVIKLKDSNILHFIDTQKRTHLSYDLTDLNDLSYMSDEVSEFLGRVGKEGIDLYQKEFKK